MIFVESWIALLRRVTNFIIGISSGFMLFLALRETYGQIERLYRQSGP